MRKLTPLRKVKKPASFALPGLCGIYTTHETVSAMGLGILLGARWHRTPIRNISEVDRGFLTTRAGLSMQQRGEFLVNAG